MILLIILCLIPIGLVALVAGAAIADALLRSPEPPRKPLE
jgi:hypothetical protein